MKEQGKQILNEWSRSVAIKLITQSNTLIKENNKKNEQVNEHVSFICYQIKTLLSNPAAKLVADFDKLVDLAFFTTRIILISDFLMLVTNEKVMRRLDKIQREINKRKDKDSKTSLLSVYAGDRKTLKECTQTVNQIKKNKTAKHRLTLNSDNNHFPRKKIQLSKPQSSPPART